MKNVAIIALISTLAGCSSYQTSMNDNNDVLVSKSTSILFFHFAKLYVCKMKKGALVDCKEGTPKLFSIEKKAMQKRQKQRRKKGGPGY